MSTPIELTINGDARQFPHGTTIDSLLQQLDLQPKLVAVEVNREVVPREVHARHQLAHGDQVEVLTLVGGG